MSGAPRQVRSLGDLRLIKLAIQDRARQQALAAAEQALARQNDTSERQLFLRAAGVVQALPEKGRALPSALRPAPVPRQSRLDERAVLREAISDEFDVSTLLDVDDQLSFRRPGIGTDVTRKLRLGHWSIQGQLDLHGLRTEDARAALTAFIRAARQQGLRCVRIVHGKGLGSPGRAPVLKHKVFGWLVQKAEILAFVQARPTQGGSGALVVLLQSALRG